VLIDVTDAFEDDESRELRPTASTADSPSYALTTSYPSRRNA
jgi:hypothetical protein